MLMLTENATSVVRALVERHELADDAGLRIAAEGGDAGSLTVSATGSPAEGDQVVEESGARVFLEPVAAATLDGMVLDARVDDEGRVEFFLGAQ